LEWLEKIELVYFLAIKNHTDFSGLDVALVEGVVTSQKDLDFIKKIRESSKILIAMGTCAMTALPSGQRNNFKAGQLEAIKDHIDKYHFLPKALALKEAVEVDDEIVGCPINEKKFIEVFEKYLD
jgi:coenzyme F420-reducing hydrogenase gamma subunit